MKFFANRPPHISRIDWFILMGPRWLLDLLFALWITLNIIGVAMMLWAWWYVLNLH